MTKAEHTEQLGTPTFGIISAKVAHMRGCMKFETSCHALYAFRLRRKSRAWFGWLGFKASLACIFVLVFAVSECLVSSTGRVCRCKNKHTRMFNPPTEREFPNSPGGLEIAVVCGGSSTGENTARRLLPLSDYCRRREIRRLPGLHAGQCRKHREYSSDLMIGAGYLIFHE